MDEALAEAAEEAETAMDDAEERTLAIATVLVVVTVATGRTPVAIVGKC